MSDDPAASIDARGETAGTECTLCGTDLSPSEYPDCRAVLVDESGPGGDEETIRMVCADCFTDLEGSLTDPEESRSSPSA